MRAALILTPRTREIGGSAKPAFPGNSDIGREFADMFVAQAQAELGGGQARADRIAGIT